MAEQIDRVASTAGTFSRAGAAVIFASAVPIAAVSLTVGMAVWLTRNFLKMGSGQ